VTTGDNVSAVGMVDTFIHGVPVRMQRDEWERDYSPRAVRLRVGRLLFGAERAEAFASGADEFGCRCQRR
jgi:hypothetical protein